MPTTARERLINTIVSIPVLGSAIGRSRIESFVTDLEATVEASARTGAADELRKQVKPWIYGSLAASGLAILMTWRLKRRTRLSGATRRRR